MADREWRPEDGDTRCQDCHALYVPWFTANETWNGVMGGPEAREDPGGYLCPTCFTKRAERSGLSTVWEVRPRDARSRKAAIANALLDDFLEARFDDGASVAEYVLATNPDLNNRLRKAFDV